MIEVEPYWNVNCMISLICDHNLFIEVEPYWNVNPIADIGRYITITLK